MPTTHVGRRFIGCGKVSLLLVLATVAEYRHAEREVAPCVTIVGVESVAFGLDMACCARLGSEPSVLQCHASTLILPTLKLTLQVAASVGQVHKQLAHQLLANHPEV